MGMRLRRIANLPAQVTESSTRAALASYGEIFSIQDEIWPKAYRYEVANGVKVITMKLAKHLPSQTNIAGHRALPSYDAHNRHGTVDSRIEVAPQSASHDQASEVSPTVDDLKPTKALLGIGEEQHEPTHTRTHSHTNPLTHEPTHTRTHSHTNPLTNEGMI